jgi:ABC-type nitrate/sulfonate/bicarbonate transport system substrate-binding protein
MKQIKRRQIIIGSAALGAAAALPVRLSAQTMPELQTLRSTSKSWLWAAEDYANARGFFTKAGVKVTSNASNRGTNIAALAGSGVDVVLGDPGEASRARNQNLAIRSFISTVNKYASNVVITNAALKKAGVTEASPEAAKAAALKGLRLGTTGPGAAPDALFRWLSVQAKLDPNTDLRLVPIQGGGPGMLAGLQQGVIDGFCLSSPTSDLAVKDRDCGYLFNMALNPPAALKQYNYIIATTSEAALADKARREALVRYAMAIAMSLKDINTNPAAFKAWADQWFAGMPDDIASRSFEINSKIFFNDPMPKQDLFDLNVSFLNTVQKTMNAAPLPASLTFASLYDPSVAQDAMKRL